MKPDAEPAGAQADSESPDNAVADSSVAVILPAAGRGNRFGRHTNKLFASLAGQPLWTHAAGMLASLPAVGRVVMAVSESDRACFQDQAAAAGLEPLISWVSGGAERWHSVASALRFLEQGAGQSLIAVHDAARPILRQAEVLAVFAEARRTGAALLAAPVSGTLKRRDPARSTCVTVDRREMFVALTPQVFAADVIRQAYARHRGNPVTDDAQLVERSGHPVSLVPGSADNLKITYPEDLRIAEAIWSTHV